MIGAFRSSRQRNVTQDQIHVVHESPIVKNHILIRTFRYVRQDHHDELSNTSVLKPSTPLWFTQENNVTTHICLVHTFPTYVTLTLTSNHARKSIKMLF